MTEEKTRKKPFSVSCFSLLLLLVYFCPQAVAEEAFKKNEHFAIGTGTIVKGNTVQGKKSAIQNALSKGIEDYLVRLLGNQMVAAHFETLSVEILPNLDQEIENFHILAEQPTGDNYNVFIKIRINENSIREKLREAGIFETVKQAVKVLFMVSESRGPLEVFWWQDPEANPALTPVELALHAVFQDRGFNPVNRIMDLPASDLVSGRSSANIQPKEAVQWGRRFSADAVVYGKSLILNDKLVLNLKAIDVQTGIQICEKSGSQKIPSGQTDSESILGIMRQCVGRMAADFCPCIRRSIETAPESVHQLDVTLAGISQPRQFQTFSEFLKAYVPGVKSVIPSRIGDDSMSATVDFQGDRITFISLVLNHQNLPFPLHLGQTDTDNILFYLE